MKKLLDYKKHEYSPKQVFARSAQADNIKSFIEADYNDVFNYFQPQRKGMYGENNTAEDQQDNVYTSLGSNCCNQFVNTIQTMVSPINGDFMDLEAGAMYARVAEQYGQSKDKLNEQLSEVNMYANELKNNVTQFDIAMSEGYYDLFVGTSCILQTKGNRKNPIIVKAIPIREFAILEGANGEVSDVFRKFENTPTEIKQIWDAEIDCDVDEEGNEKPVKLLECSYLDEMELDYVYSVYTVEKKKQIYTERSKTCPFTVARWGKEAGETWGKGVGMSALADMKTYNGMVKNSYQASAYEVPMFQVQDDGMFDVDEIELEGGVIVSLPESDSGSEGIQQIQVNNRRENSRINMQELELAIMKTCLASGLPDSLVGQNATATEIMEVSNSLKQDYTSVFGRLIHFQQALVRRFFGVLGEQGLLNDRKSLEPLIDTDKIDGLWFACAVNTPLTKALAMGEVKSMVQTISMFLQLDPTGAVLNKTLKLNESTIKIADKVGYPIDLIYNLEEIKQNEKAMAQQQQQAQVGERELNVLEANAIERGKVANK